MPTAPQIDAPQSLASFFPASSDEGEDEEFDQCYETQTVSLCEKELLVRQYVFHSHNANRVWPGTFNLCEYLFEHKDEFLKDTTILELGAATGLLSIRLAMEGINIVTSDVADDGQVEENINHNFGINGFKNDIDSLESISSPSIRNKMVPIHIPHTWGTGWKESWLNKVKTSTTHQSIDPFQFDHIIASDILLYVSVYPSLVQTLVELFSGNDNKDHRERLRFIMSWNRRMKDSENFFRLMNEAGFEYDHVGKCVFIFRMR